jgi:hypothetical protein
VSLRRLQPAHERTKERTLTLTVGMTHHLHQESSMNNIIWIIGAIVVVLAILSFLGLR